MMKNIRLNLFYSLALAVTTFVLMSKNLSAENEPAQVSLHILGVAQDAGYPQLNCYQPHCLRAWKSPELKRLTSSLGLIDRKNKQKFLFDATPDIKQQLYNLHLLAPDGLYSLSGIFLTHAHMGHYSGLIHLGREAAGSQNIAVYAMPRMTKFLTENGPWNQLVKLNNIQLKPLKELQVINLTEQIKVEAFLVPHRDEYSETVGYKIIGPNKTALFIPDIDKWKKWSTSIAEQITKVDYALLDATFFANGELANRDMSEVPHPFVEESMALLSSLSPKDKQKVIFIHFNHSNPLLIENSEAQQTVKRLGFRVAREGLQLDL